MSKTTKDIYIATGIALLLVVGFLYYKTCYLDRSFQRIEKDNSGIPVKVVFLDTCISLRNSGFSYNLTKLTLTNDFDSPRWYLFPMFLSDTLPLDGIFYTRRDTPFIEGRKLPVEKSNLRIVNVRFYGGDAIGQDETFSTFYLPPKSTVILDNYPFLMKEEALTRTYEIWEVEQLMADGKIPFDEWVSCNLMCSGNVRLTQKATGKACALGIEILVSKGQNPSLGSLLPKLKATHIQAIGIRRLFIKMKQYE